MLFLCVSPHVVFVCHACGSCASPSVVRASGSRVDHVCRAASAQDNKLLSLINSHVNNVNSSGHMFYIINLRFAQLIFISRLD
jgi:hypothetical protein